MKLTVKEKKLINQFNRAETKLVISRWPSYAKASDGQAITYDGIATYTQDTVTRFAKRYDTKFVVMADKSNKPKDGLELVAPNILVVRAFEEHRFHLYPQVLVWLNAFSKIKNVYVHSEFCASGGPVIRFLVVPFLALIRLTGREITFYAHNVVKTLTGYEQHLGYREKSLELELLSWGYRWYFRLLSLLVQTFVVLEESVAQRLISLVGKRQVLVEPHWIAPVRQALTQNKAKNELGIEPKTKLVVSFGFVTHYKGADFVADFSRWLTNNHKLPGTQLVLAGGMAYSLKDKGYYQTYYRGIETRAARNDNLILTGFLSEKEVKLWLTAADLVIFPYRNLMGGSGALQQALRYGKPVLLSTQMAKGLGVTQADLIFSYKYGELEKQINRYFGDVLYGERVRDLSRCYATKLSMDKLMPKHYTEVYGNPELKSIPWYSKGIEGLRHAQSYLTKIAVAD